MLFRRSMIAVLLILSMFLPLIHATPAQAQGCSPGCLAVTVNVTCGNGSLPPNQGNGQYFAELTGPYTRGRLIPYTTTMTYDGKQWRVYSFLETNHPTGNWSAKWKQMTGPFAGIWSGTLGPKNLVSGGAISFTFYYHNGALC